MDKQTALREIMTRDLITLHPDDHLLHVNKVFERFGFHHIPITDVHRQVVGIVSKSDMLQLSSLRPLLSAKEYEAIRVGDFMTTDVLVLSPDDSIGLAADIFIANKFHAIPIVEDHSLVGLVTTHDLITFAFGSVL